MHDSKPKFHHLTSQNYLGYFAFNKEGKIFRYDKNTGVTKPLPIKKIGGENDYYTNFHNGQKDTTLENPILSEIDGSYTSLIQKFQSRQSIESFREDLTLFLATQYARVRPQRNRWISVIEDLNSQRAKLGVRKKDLWSVDNGNLNTTMLIEAGVYSNVVSNTSFFGVFISEKDEFITCDNPADKCFLPLTSNMCLFQFSEKHEQEYVLIPNEMVKEINQKTYDKAHRWVYAKTRNTITALQRDGKLSGALGIEAPAD